MGVSPIFITVIFNKMMGGKASREIEELRIRQSCKVQVPGINSASGAKTIKKNTNSTQNKSQTNRAKQYKVTSSLSTDCELSTETCSKNVYSLFPRRGK